VRRAWPLYLLLLSAPIVAVSLYLPWQERSCGSGASFFQSSGGPTAGLPNLFACATAFHRVDGRSILGYAVVLCALFLLLDVVAVVASHRWELRAPPGALGLLLADLTVGLFTQTRFSVHQAEQQLRLGGATASESHFHLAYGAVVGLTGAAAALIGAVFATDLRSVRPSPRRLAAACGAFALLAALVLEWQRIGVFHAARFGEAGVAIPPGTLAAGAAVALVAACSSGRSTPQLLPAGLAGVALLCVGGAFAGSFSGARTVSAWVGMAVAAATALVLFADRSLLRSIRRPTAITAAVGVAGGAIVTSLFLPWQTACYRTGGDLDAVGLAGRCVSSNGFDVIGAVTAAVAVALVAVVTARPARVIAISLELAIALALLVATLGSAVRTGSASEASYGFGYGAFVCFVGAGALIALVVVRAVRPSRVRPLRRLQAQLVPIALALAYVAAVVVPWWEVLPDRVWSTFVIAFAFASWLTVAGALIGLRLAFAWAEQAIRGARSVALLPLSVTLVALSALDTLAFPALRLSWNAAVLLGLSVPLLVAALIADRGGIRIPAILRIDRIA
jgi:hypothetical protein